MIYFFIALAPLERGVPVSLYWASFADIFQKCPRKPPYLYVCVCVCVSAFKHLTTSLVSVAATAVVVDQHGATVARQRARSLYNVEQLPSGVYCVSSYISNAAPPDRPPPLSAPPLSTGSLMQMRIWYIHVYLDQWHKLGVSTEGRRGLGMANIKKTNNIIYLFIRIWIWIRITFITSCCTSTQRLKWSGLVP